MKSSNLWTNHYLVPYFGKYKLSDINVDMINTFWQVLKEKHGLAPKTINNIRSVFIIMMKEAVNRGIIGSNPVEKTFARMSSIIGIQAKEKLFSMISLSQCGMLVTHRRR